jgi:hypothetical protein
MTRCKRCNIVGAGNIDDQAQGLKYCRCWEEFRPRARGVLLQVHGGVMTRCKRCSIAGAERSDDQVQEL